MFAVRLLKQVFNHNHKKRKDSLEAWAKQAVLCAYVENQAMPEPILLYRASKYKQRKGRAIKTVCELPSYLPQQCSSGRILVLYLQTYLRLLIALTMSF